MLELMIVMPSNASGWFWHCLARETCRIGHLHTPGSHRGPWPWFPFALDNGAFSCWNPTDNSFDSDRWKQTEPKWRHLLFWAQAAPIRPRWAIVPDRPGHAEETFQKWSEFAGYVESSGIPLALAVQDGMMPVDVRALRPIPAVVCVGGTTQWKWETIEMWARAFPRVHLLRCNSPTKLHYLEKLGIESCDGTGWNRGDRKQTQGVEDWARRWHKHEHPLWPHVCRQPRDPKEQEVFA
jgi:hypothetical protein